MSALLRFEDQTRFIGRDTNSLGRVNGASGQDANTRLNVRQKYLHGIQNALQRSRERNASQNALQRRKISRNLGCNRLSDIRLNRGCDGFSGFFNGTDIVLNFSNNSRLYTSKRFKIAQSATKARAYKLDIFDNIG